MAAKNAGSSASVSSSFRSHLKIDEPARQEAVNAPYESTIVALLPRAVLDVG